MNDSELITAVRESFTGVRSATPVEQIANRSRAVRARRWVPVLAAVLAVAAGAAVGVTALTPAHHQASGPTGAQPGGLDGGQAGLRLRSRSPCASCVTPPGCSAGSAPMVSRPP